MNSCDMQEELFVSMMSSKNLVPIDYDRVADERRYYQMTPSVDSKWLALYELMKLYDSAGLYDESIGVCQEGLNNPLLKDYWEGIYFRMGQISEHKRDFDAALGFYLKSLELGAGDPLGQYWQHNNAAFCHLIRREFDQAEAHCTIALDIDGQDWKGYRRRWGDPLHWNAWKNMGVAMEHTGRVRDAASFYTVAVKLSRGGERAILHLRRLLKRNPDLAVYWKEPIEDLKVYYDVQI